MSVFNKLNPDDVEYIYDHAVRWCAREGHNIHAHRYALWYLCQYDFNGLELGAHGHSAMFKRFMNCERMTGD